MRPKQAQNTKSLEDREIDVMVALDDLSWMDRYPVEKKHVKVIARILAKFVQTVEVDHVGCEDPSYDLGLVNPLRWLIDEVGRSRSRFPPPIEWRRIYEERFSPLDGQRASDIEA